MLDELSKIANDKITFEMLTEELKTGVLYYRGATIKCMSAMDEEYFPSNLENE